VPRPQGVQARLLQVHGTPAVGIDVAAMTLQRVVELATGRLAFGKQTFCIDAERQGYSPIG